METDTATRAVGGQCGNDSMGVGYKWSDKDDDFRGGRAQQVETREE